MFGQKTTKKNVLMGLFIVAMVVCAAFAFWTRMVEAEAQVAEDKALMTQCIKDARGAWLLEAGIGIHDDGTAVAMIAVALFNERTK